MILESTVVLGCLYSLQAVSFVLILRATGILIFAQGQILALGGYAFYQLTAVDGLKYGPGFVATGVLVGAFGVLLYTLILRRMEGSPPWSVVMALFGVGEMLNAVIAIKWGSNPFTLHPPIASRTVIFPGGIRFDSVDLLLSGAAALLVIAVFLITYSTPLGLRMRAASENRFLANYIGVRVRGVARTSWFLASFLAAAAGIAIAIRTDVSPDLVNSFLTAFPAVLIGGVESLTGAVLGSFLLAAILSASSLYLNSDVALPLAYGLLLLLLMVRPQGLFGSLATVRL